MGENSPTRDEPVSFESIVDSVVLVLLDLPSLSRARSPLGLPKERTGISTAGRMAGFGAIELALRFLEEGPCRGWKPEPSGEKAGWLWLPPSISKSCAFATPDCVQKMNHYMCQFGAMLCKATSSYMSIFPQDPIAICTEQTLR